MADKAIEHLDFDDLAERIRRVFLRHRCSEAVAAVLADNMARAERDGSESHGIFRLPGYAGSLDSGWADGRATPDVVNAASGAVVVEAGNGFAQPALAAGRRQLVDKARHNGIAMLLIRDSHHFGALWPDIEPFAEEGLLALSVVNSMAAVVPHGGHTALLGTNPIGFAAPRDGGDPLVFDMATSAMAHGDVQIAAREGRTVPEGTGLDAGGRPTTDASAIIEGGALSPFGGHKGSAISVMIELLSAGLTGGNFSFEVDWSGHPGACTPHTGQFVLVIDPACSGAATPFPVRTGTMVEALEQSGLTRLPGQRRFTRRRACAAHGIPLTAAQLDMLETV